MIIEKQVQQAQQVGNNTKLYRYNWVYITKTSLYVQGETVF